MKNQKLFNLEEAKAGKVVLCDGVPCTFIAHIPEARQDCRVVIMTCEGLICTYTEDGRPYPSSCICLTMAEEEQLTLKFRMFILKSETGNLWPYTCTLTPLSSEEQTISSVEAMPHFHSWVDMEWKQIKVKV